MKNRSGTFPSDELGKIGELIFDRLCTQALLVCNKSSHDRTGWDYIVEFPFDELDEKTFLDSRKSAMSCHVQVKTMHAQNDTFKVSLSIAERLAKETKPTFIYVLKMDKYQNHVSSYLLHLDDEMLDMVLKRLRISQQKNRSKINKQDISFVPSRDGKCIGVSGQDFKNKVIELCGNNMHEYILAKKDKLKKRGFGDRPHTIETKMQVENSSEIVDWLLGLKSLKAVSISRSETRYGIKIPIPSEDFNGAIISIKPSPISSCTIIAESNQFYPPASFKGSIFVPMMNNIPTEIMKIMIEVNLFRIIFDSECVSFIPNNELLENGYFEVDQWIDYFKLLLVLSGSVGCVKIHSNYFISGQIVLPEMPSIVDAAEAEYNLHIFECARRLFYFAGSNDTTLRFSEISRKYVDVMAASCIIENIEKEAQFSFRFTPTNEHQLPHSIDFLFVRRLCIAGKYFGFYYFAEMIKDETDEQNTWRSVKVKNKELRLIQNGEQEYHLFADEVKAKYKFAYFADFEDGKLKIDDGT